VICGQNILTSNDRNDCGLTDFTAFGMISYNFMAHYPGRDAAAQALKDNLIRKYHTAHANPVLALEDDGYIKIDHQGVNIVRGHCWLFELGQEKILLEHGYISWPPTPH
jgi:hypothetical protein